MTVATARDSTPPAQPMVAVIVLNWNAWADTLECLESLLRLDYPAYRIIVCDNQSTDGSVERIIDWAEGLLDAPIADNRMQRLSRPAAAKPVEHQILDRDKAGQMTGVVEDLPLITLIQTGANLGFAGGNNVGLRFALANGFDAFWLLNPDTVADRGALGALVQRMRSDPRIGLCGSTLRYYDEPSLVQELGGCARIPFLSSSYRIGGDSSADAAVDRNAIEQRLYYVSGASCFTSRPFLNEIGLLAEDYFLYYEEADWAMRGRALYSLAFAPDSIVYHKKGKTSGSSAISRSRTPASTYHLWRSRLIYTRCREPWGLPFVLIFSLMTAVLVMMSGEKGQVTAVIQGTGDGLMGKKSGPLPKKPRPDLT